MSNVPRRFIKFTKQCEPHQAKFKLNQAKPIISCLHSAVALFNWKRCLSLDPAEDGVVQDDLLGFQDCRVVVAVEVWPHCNVVFPRNLNLWCTSFLLGFLGGRLGGLQGLQLPRPFIVEVVPFFLCIFFIHSCCDLGIVECLGFIIELLRLRLVESPLWNIACHGWRVARLMLVILTRAELLRTWSLPLLCCTHCLISTCQISSVNLSVMSVTIILTCSTMPIINKLVNPLPKMPADCFFTPAPSLRASDQDDISQRRWLPW